MAIISFLLFEEEFKKLAQILTKLMHWREHLPDHIPEIHFHTHQHKAPFALYQPTKTNE